MNSPRRNPQSTLSIASFLLLFCHSKNRSLFYPSALSRLTSCHFSPELARIAHRGAQFSPFFFRFFAFFRFFSPLSQKKSTLLGILLDKAPKMWYNIYIMKGAVLPHRPVA